MLALGEPQSDRVLKLTAYLEKPVYVTSPFVYYKKRSDGLVEARLYADNYNYDLYFDPRLGKYNQGVLRITVSPANAPGENYMVWDWGQVGRATEGRNNFGDPQRFQDNPDESGMENFQGPDNRDQWNLRYIQSLSHIESILGLQP